LEKIIRWREINPALLDQLRAQLVSESVPHQALHLVPRKGLLLHPGRQGKDQPHRQQDTSQRFPESHCDLARLSWTKKNLWGDCSANEQADIRLSAVLHQIRESESKGKLSR
jgi:hypothetical protein